MMPFFEFMKEQVVYLLSLWANEDIANAIGANFLYIMLAIWLTWIVVNTYLVRPISGSLFGSAVTNERRNAREISRQEKAEQIKNETQHKEDIRVGRSTRYDL